MNAKLEWAKQEHPATWTSVLFAGNPQPVKIFGCDPSRLYFTYDVLTAWGTEYSAKPNELQITGAPAAASPTAAGDSLQARRAESARIPDHITSFDEVSCPTCWGTGINDHGNVCVCQPRGGEVA